MINFRKLPDIVPYILARSPEYMCPIAVDIDSIHILRIAVPTDVRTPIYNKNPFPGLGHFMRDNSTEESCTNNCQIVIAHVSN